jgi:hypothetical protein
MTDTLVNHNNTIDMNTLWRDSHIALLRMVCAELDAVERVDDLVAKFLCEKVKLKKKKDLNKPKRAKSSFMFFCQKRRPVLIAKARKENADGKVRVAEISKKLGKEWNAMSDKKRSPYVEKADADKERYNKAMAVYNDKH